MKQLLVSFFNIRKTKLIQFYLQLLLTKYCSFFRNIHYYKMENKSYICRHTGCIKKFLSRSSRLYHYANKIRFLVAYTRLTTRYNSICHRLHFLCNIFDLRQIDMYCCDEAIRHEDPRISCKTNDTFIF